MWTWLMRRVGLLFRSLKARLTTVLILSSMIPLTLIGIISYYAIFSILDNKLEEGVRNNLRQVKLSLETSLSHLNHVSQQLSFDGSVGKNMRDYLNVEDLYQKKLLQDEIINEFNLISFTNPALGLIFYYVPNNHEYLFPNYDVVDDFSFDALPVLADYTDMRGFTYYGPHRTMKKYHNHIVLSVAREVQFMEDEPLYVFIETEFKLVQELLESDQERMRASHVIVENDGIISYSNNPRFVIGESYYETAHQDYFVFEDASSQGWRVVSVIPRSEYNREINQWLFQFFALAIFSFGISLLFAWLIWRTVYRPLKSFNHEIVLMSKSNFHSRIKYTGIKEFDFLLTRFQDMRQKIWELLKAVEVEEKRKASLEVEKLMNQINPHFIHNTLDTIRWLARMSGQDEIDRLVSTLNKVLYYNLGKGKTATIEDEIQALKNYVSLQQIRYNFQFDVCIMTDPEIRNASIPRFILQPLVENALYHGGLLDDGVIQVNIVKDGDVNLRIEVTDNGSGMDESVIRQLLQYGVKNKAGMGIGINYVHRMIRFQFGDDAEFNIESGNNAGTTVTMRLPFHIKGDIDHESTDSG